ncbi:MAG: imidazole glycerol phosphate synthase subunit HisH [Leptospirales bacterium]
MNPGTSVRRVKKKIVELDFGMGNIRSLQKAFEHVGATVDVVTTPEKISGADALLIPGDGAFGRAMENIKLSEFYEPICEFIKTGKPVFGVCIGFQVLFDMSQEYKTAETGFGVFPGEISRFTSTELSIPHMGWNTLHKTRDSKILQNIREDEYFYFVHSFRHAGTHKDAVGVCNYGGEFTAVVEKDNVVGVQFHPEKSHTAGLQLISNFLENF